MFTSFLFYRLGPSFHILNWEIVIKMPVSALNSFYIIFQLRGSKKKKKNWIAFLESHCVINPLTFLGIRTVSVVCYPGRYTVWFSYPVGYISYWYSSISQILYCLTTIVTKTCNTILSNKILKYWIFINSFPLGLIVHILEVY